MPGIIDFTGTTVNTLQIGRAVRLRPAPVHETECAICHSRSTATYAAIRDKSARCKASVCGQSIRKSTREGEERQRCAARERVALDEEARLAEQRMSAEVEDYKLPSKIRPAPEYVPMSDRDRQAIRARREEERHEEEERQRPIKEATEQLNAMHREIAKIQADTLTNDKVLDADLWIDPTVDGIEMKRSEAATFNRYHLTLFAEEHPNIAGTEHNARLLTSYFEKHGINIVTYSMLEKLYERLTEAGVFLDEKPAPEPEPDVMRYDKREPVELRISAPQGPPTYRGFDLETGEPRVYSEREVNKMSSEQMKKALQMTTRGELELPRVGPGPKGSKG